MKAQECAMIGKLGSDINSIDASDIKNSNKVPLEAKPTQFWGRRLELEKSVFKNSSFLVNEIVTKVENATENDDKEVLFAVLKQHVEKICKETFLDNNGENPSLPEWVTVAKSQNKDNPNYDPTKAESRENSWLKPITDRQGINNEFYQAFQKIYRKQGVEDSSEEIQELLDSGGDTKPSEYLKSKALTNQESENIEGEITLTELNHALFKKMKGNSAPSIDGFTANWFVQFLDSLKLVTLMLSMSATETNFLPLLEEQVSFVCSGKARKIQH